MNKESEHSYRQNEYITCWSEKKIQIATHIYVQV